MHGTVVTNDTFKIMGFRPSNITEDLDSEDNKDDDEDNFGMLKDETGV